MGELKIVESDSLDSGLTEIANAIRSKANSTELLSFPSGMVECIETIKTVNDLLKIHVLTLTDDFEYVYGSFSLSDFATFLLSESGISNIYKYLIININQKPISGYYLEYITNITDTPSAYRRTTGGTISVTQLTSSLGGEYPVGSTFVICVIDEI